jgi:hypothetical protein
VQGLYEVRKITTTGMRRFNTEARDYKVDIRDHAFPDNITIDESLSRMYHILKGMIRDLLGHLDDTAHARMVIIGGDLETPISLSMQNVRNITPELIITHISDVVQSGKTFFMNSDMRIHVIHTVIPAGRGAQKKACVQLRDKRSILEVCNDNNLCLATSLIFGKEIADKGTRAASKLKHAAKRTARCVRDLHRSAGVAIDEKRAYTLEDVVAFQHVWEGQYQIIVISSATLNMPAYTGIAASKKIYIYHHEDHYNVITDIDRFYGENQAMCTVCWKVHSKRWPHYKCTGQCRLCHHKECGAEQIPSDSIQWNHCVHCNRYFPSKLCHANHRIIAGGETRSCCSYIHRCIHCSRTLNKSKIDPEKHDCGKVYCTVCRARMESGHRCHVRKMQCDESKDEVRWAKHRVFYFDFETCGSDGEHTPVMVAMVDEKGVNKKVFWGSNCAEDFCKHIFSKKKFKKSIFMSHNGGRFDQYFILDQIFKAGYKPEIIYNGGSMLYLHIKQLGITFKDTYLFMSRSLAALPKMFGLPDIGKTYFPHLLDFGEYADYNGVYVSTKFYDVNQMNPMKRAECIAWVEERQKDGSVFNYKQNMIEYCENDVEVLRACGEKFRKLFREKGETDPFIDAFTLSQASSYVYRKLHMPENSIAIIPPWGYKSARAYSNKGVVWLEYMAMKLSLRITHARNGGEAKVVGGLFVDGFIPPTPSDTHKGHVLEFVGCHTHGCLTCYKPGTVNPRCGSTMRTLNDQYLSRKALICWNGYKYTEIWEHQYDAKIKVDGELSAVELNLDLQEPMKPRDCLYGGRVEAFRLFTEIDELLAELIKYLDVNSLYPYVQRESDFPESHPTEIMLAPKAEDFKGWFGLVKLRITAPQRLWLPVLPLRINGKLFFPLCYTCTLEANTQRCTHEYKKRGWVGAYTTPEVVLALEKGYVIDKVYEVWHWDEDSITSDLFTSYINSFLKLKLMGSGFPRPDMTDEEKTAYARELSDREGVEIDMSEIEDNPGIRALGKQVINSLWGKICQNTDKSKTVYITLPSEYFTLLLEDKYNVQDVRKVNETTIEVTYTIPKELAEPHAFVNHAVASFVTSYARIHLYSFMEKLGENLLYADTDSVVFLTAPGKPDLPTGACLGEMSCEIYSTHKKHDTIKSFVTVGPKSYGYQLRDNPDIKCVKCKGITLNYNTSRKINMEYMVDLVTRDGFRQERTEVAYTNQIKRDRKKVKIMSINTFKSFGFTFDKRLVDNVTYKTLPIGYTAE